MCLLCSWSHNLTCNECKIYFGQSLKALFLCSVCLLSAATVAPCTLSLQSWWWSSKGLPAWGQCSSAWGHTAPSPVQPHSGSPPWAPAEKFFPAPRGTPDSPRGSCTPEPTAPRCLPPGFRPGCPSPQWQRRMWPSSGRRCPGEPSLTRTCWSPATWTGSSQREVNLNYSRLKTAVLFSRVMFLLVHLCRPGSSEVLLRPQTTEEVSQILR